MSTTIDAAESVAKQISSGTKEGKSVSQSVSFGQTFSDVVSNKLAGVLTKNVNTSQIKTAERQLDRATRVSAGDPLSSGRAKAVKDARVNLAKEKGVNKAAEGVVGNTIQNISNAARSGGGSEMNNYNFYRTDPNLFIKQKNNNIK